jgi:AmmeMemoRadiSam system protein B/AmmeMemoRadiSam system protein A
VVLTLAVWGGLVQAVCAAPRTAKVAGAFYPADPGELRALVQGLLDQPSPLLSPERGEGTGEGRVRILIVPHAGYQYSGPVAARGYRMLQGQSYDGVVVVGFMHRLPFEGASVDTSESYRTPLGELPVDQQAAERLLAQPGLAHAAQAHETDEHSLEVQLPFLQVALGHVKLIPVLMGSAEWEGAERLAEALAALARQGDYLFIFSTDLSHDHPYDEAKAIDERTIGAILFETPQAVERFFDAGVLEACGRGPIVTALLLASKLGYPRRELLTSANSGDTAGDRSRVVGYAAIGMFDRAVDSSERLSSEAGRALVQAARGTLEHSLRKADGLAAAVAGLAQYPELSRPTGIFVTLHKQGRLRGCIGHIEGIKPLSEAVAEVALDAALRDPRFEPLTAEELRDIDVEISVLSPPVLLGDVRELVAGRDGVVLEHQGRHGVFLPQVWEETGWTRVEFLRELASQKAGLPPDAWQQATLSVFQDQVFREE